MATPPTHHPNEDTILATHPNEDTMYAHRGRQDGDALAERGLHVHAVVQPELGAISEERVREAETAPQHPLTG